MENIIIDASLISKIKNGDQNSFEQLHNNLSFLIEKSYKTFCFITYDLYIKITKEVLSLFIKTYDVETMPDFLESFKTKFEKLIYVKLKDYISDLSNDIITNYIKNKRNKLKGIVEIISKTSYEDNIDFTIEILDKYPEVSKQINNIINTYKSLNQENVDEFFDNKRIAHFIRVYLIKNNLGEVEENEESLKEIITDEDILKLINSSDRRLLTREEETELAKRVEQGDQLAVQIFVEKNQRLIMKVAARYTGRGVEFEDLVQEGNLGILKAIEKFDWRQGMKFSTYAIWWIRQAITRAIADKGRAVRLPVHRHEKEAKVKKIIEQFEHENLRLPTIEEISDIIDIDEEILLQIIATAKTDSLNSAVKDDSENELQDFLPDLKQSTENIVYQNQMQEEVNQMLERSNLTGKELFILKSRMGFFDGEVKTLEEIGKVLHVTRERIRQLENKALKKLRKSKFAQNLANYMDDPNQALEFARNTKNNSFNNNRTMSLREFTKDRKIKKEGINMGRKRRETKNLYNYLGAQTPAEHQKVSDIILLLPPEEQTVVYKKCGEKLTGTDVNLTEKERMIFYGRALPKLETRYKKVKDIDINSEKYNEILLGNNSKHNKIITITEDEGTQKNAARRGKSVVNLIAYFSNAYTKEELMSALNLLSSKEKEIILKKFGPELDGVDGSELAKEDRIMYNSLVVPKLRIKLKKLYPEKAMYAMSKAQRKHKEQEKEKITTESSVQKIKEEVTVVKPEETVLIKPTEKTPEIIPEIAVEDPEITKIEDLKPQFEIPKVIVRDEYSLTNNDYRAVKNIFKSPYFAELTRYGFSLDQATIISLFQGYAGKELSIEQISGILGIEKEFVRETIVKATKFYQENLNKAIDEYVMSLTKSLPNDVIE